MAVINLITTIQAPRERVFDLARSIDAHQASTSKTNERAIAGKTSSLLALGDEVTWEARHFGVRQKLKIKITAFDPPCHFQDVMVAGAFKALTHGHFFKETEGKTVMTDRFEFHAPLGILGTIAEKLFLVSYMRHFLLDRNQVLKRIAESDDWKLYLK